MNEIQATVNVWVSRHTQIEDEIREIALHFVEYAPVGMERRIRTADFFNFLLDFACNERKDVVNGSYYKRLVAEEGQK